MIKWMICALALQLQPGLVEADKEFAQEVYELCQCVQPLHPEKLHGRFHAEWLSMHDEEGQSFEAYFNRPPKLPTPWRRYLYILPLGEFSDQETQAVKITANYMKTFYNLPVKILPTVADSVIPARYQRSSWYGDKQLHSRYVLYKYLYPQLPEDAAALIAFTSADLWSGEADSNFLFGQASLVKRVGVWSLARYGFDDESVSSEQALRRTIKVALHETGHMFSMKHCTAYQCLMNGSNHLDESDGTPLQMCPECLPKLLLLTHQSPKDHFFNMFELARDLKMRKIQRYYHRAYHYLKENEE